MHCESFDDLAKDSSCCDGGIEVVSTKIFRLNSEGDIRFWKCKLTNGHTMPGRRSMPGCLPPKCLLSWPVYVVKDNDGGEFRMVQNLSPTLQIPAKYVIMLTFDECKNRVSRALE